MATGLTIGKIEVPSRVLVAPMSGITDLPFRRVLQTYAPGYVVSEMVAGRELSEGHPGTEMRAAGAGEIDPLVIQLVGNEAEWMERGAARAEALGADIVDINMGCPARKVTKGLAGSALMRDPELAARLIEATVRGTSKTVTLKMRLGWDDELLNAPEIARRAQASGVAMICVHGRTRCQFYEGRADWDAVRATVESVDMPVVVNGDIDSGASAVKALEASGAAGVMIGRSLVGRPWLISDMREALGELAAPPAPKAVVAANHYRDIIATFGEHRGVRMARKHVQGYLQHAGASDVNVRQALRLTDPNAVIETITAHLSERVAA